MLFSCNYDNKSLILLKITTENEVQPECIEYITFNKKQTFQMR